MRRWKIALGLNAFGSLIETYGVYYSLPEVLDRAAKLGYDGIELFPYPACPMPTPPRTPPEKAPRSPYPQSRAGRRLLRMAYLEYGLEIPAIQSRPEGRPASPNGKVRERHVETLEEQIEFAVEVGARNVGVWPAARLTEDFTRDGAVELAIDTYSRVVGLAEDYDVTLSFEGEPNLLINTPELVKRLLDGVHSKHFRYLYDFAHANVTSGGKPLELLKLIEGRVGWLHVTDNDGTRFRGEGTSTHLPLGEGTMDYELVLKNLFDVGYEGNGWIQVDLWQYPDLFHGFERSKRKLEETLAKMG